MFVNRDKKTSKEIVCNPTVRLLEVATDIMPLGLKFSSEAVRDPTLPLGDTLKL